MAIYKIKKNTISFTEFPQENTVGFSYMYTYKGVEDQAEGQLVWEGTPGQFNFDDPIDAKYIDDINFYVEIFGDGSETSEEIGGFIIEKYKEFFVKKDFDNMNDDDDDFNEDDNLNESSLMNIVKEEMSTSTMDIINNNRNPSKKWEVPQKPEPDKKPDVKPDIYDIVEKYKADDWSGYDYQAIVGTIEKVISGDVQCMNCGEQQSGLPVYFDNLGDHCLCPKCDSSFDIDDYDEENVTEWYAGTRYGGGDVIWDNEVFDSFEEASGNAKSDAESKARVKESKEQMNLPKEYNIKQFVNDEFTNFDNDEADEGEPKIFDGASRAYKVGYTAGMEWERDSSIKLKCPYKAGSNSRKEWTDGVDDATGGSAVIKESKSPNVNDELKIVVKKESSPYNPEWACVKVLCSRDGVSMKEIMDALYDFSNKNENNKQYLEKCFSTSDNSKNVLAMAKQGPRYMQLGYISAESWQKYIERFHATDGSAVISRINESAKMRNLKRENMRLKSKSNELREALKIHTNVSNDISLLNTKTGLAKKLFNEHLSKSSKETKMNVLKAFDKATTIQESKNIYNAIVRKVNGKKSVKKNLNESKNFTVRRIKKQVNRNVINEGLKMHKKEKGLLTDLPTVSQRVKLTSNQINEEYDGWARLAGLNKNKK